jgi:kynurenine 3-monooxygenase
LAPHDPPQFTIVGAGLAGALMACYLGKAGYRVDLYEKRLDPRGTSLQGGRSINLAISVRGLHALHQVGLAEEVLRTAIPMRGRMMHAPSGKLTFQPYGKDASESINSISRAGLNLTLVNAAARYKSVRLFFDQKCTGIDVDTATLELTHETTHAVTHVPAACVIGSDGAYSAVRAAMQKQDCFNYRQDYLSHGYKELTMPAGPEGRFRMDKHALHIWPRHAFMMIALPNFDGSFTCTLFLPFEGSVSFAALRTEAAIERFFREQFPDALELMPGLVEDFLKHPTGSMVTVRCSPWHVDGRVVLLGDACHAVVPFLGQGMNAAFEDCAVLHECLRSAGPRVNLAAVFQEYESLRKVHTDTLADLCIDNFLEMRDRVSSRSFLLQKKAGIFLHALFPRWYLPLYTLITFTRTPYADAVRRVRVQRRVVWTAAAGLGLLLLAILLILIRTLVYP